MYGRYIVSFPLLKKSTTNSRRIGFVVDSLLPAWKTCLAGKTLRPLLSGWPSNTAGTVMRFGWLAEYVNSRPDRRWIYELYRPWRSYEALVFIKSMDHPCRELAVSQRRKDRVAVFDANVDYFTPASGTWYYAGMEPTLQQRDESCAMAGACSAVIADSRHLLEKVKPFNSRAKWIPDNIPDKWIANVGNRTFVSGGKLTLLWSGEAVKLFELLKIETVLRRFRKHVHIRLVTGRLDALSRIFEPWQGRLRRLLEDLDCEIIPFRDIPALLNVYDQGGVCISPRFLDNTYNMGHTEWKISLAMARGRVALASPQPSYCDLKERAGEQGIRICGEGEDWVQVLESMLAGKFPWGAEQERASAVVRQHYATSIVAQTHLEWLESLVRQCREDGNAESL